MIPRMPSAKDCNNPAAADPGSCHLRSCAAKTTSKGVTGSPRLLAEDENTSLAGKAGFFYLSVLSEEQGVIGGLSAAVFPPAFGFGNNLLAFLHGGLVSIDLQSVFTGLQLEPAEFRGLRNVDGLCKGFCKCRHCQRNSGQQSHAADK